MGFHFFELTNLSTDVDNILLLWLLLFKAEMEEELEKIDENLMKGLKTLKKEITWEKFELNNLDKTHSFENLCRLLFKHEFCPVGTVLYSKANHPGVEIEPVASIDGKMISFQSKYFSNKIKYEEIKNSADKTVKYYSGKLDTWYLYCNLPVDKTTF